MFPITLEFSDGKVASCWPPCYGFLRDVEWTDWTQRFHFGSRSIRYARRERLYSENGITPEKPLGERLGMHCYDTGSDEVPSCAFDLEGLKYIWNSGARVPVEARVNVSDEKPVAWRFPEDEDYLSYDKTGMRRKQSPLERFNLENNQNLTLQEVLTDLEKNIDAGRESVLHFRDDGYGAYLGVYTVDTPCDRVLFYLMVGRELDGYYPSKRMETFLHLHYCIGIPIMVAFMASRILAYEVNDRITYVGDTGDGCILPVQNFWRGCAARYKKPCAIEWQQHSYTDGDGHKRDEDLNTFYMSPKIPPFKDIGEEFNESMFNAVFGGCIEDHVLLDRPGGEPVANLVCEFYRTVADKTAYRERGGNEYCPNWTSDRALHDFSSSSFSVARGLWMDRLLTLLMEE